MGWLLSSDSHIVEPPELWTSRVSAKHREMVPRVEEFEGVGWWHFGAGRTELSYGQLDQAGRRFEGGAEALDREATFSDVREGSHEPDLFLKDCEADGVWGAVIFPTIGLLTARLQEPEAVELSCRVYNDWLGEFCAYNPSRLKGAALICTDDIANGVAELSRARNDLGLGAAAISVSPTLGHKYNRPEYEPLWAAAQDLDMPLCFHLGSNRTPWELVEISSRTGISNIDKYVKDSIGRMIFSGVFDRYPGLKVVSVENDAGWAPWFIWRMDYAFTEQRHYEGLVKFKDPDMMPSDFFAQNVFVSFQEDPIAIENRYRIGVDNLMFGNDYPHAESTFPQTREILDRILGDIPADEREKIQTTNTARVFGFDVPEVTNA